MPGLILLGASIYATVGTLFGAGFVLRGVERVDPAALGAPWTFRILILPGVIALWPLMAWRWWCAPRTRGAA
ncbi:MAG: hypothetical protein L6Q92_07640 [Phycisphaerae bacterium]|nr:hypothetical protein [Phycisphaerae bacterium]